MRIIYGEIGDLTMPMFQKGCSAIDQAMTALQECIINFGSLIQDKMHEPNQTWFKSETPVSNQQDSCFLSTISH